MNCQTRGRIFVARNSVISTNKWRNNTKTIINSIYLLKEMTLSSDYLSKYGNNYTIIIYKYKDN